MTYAARGPKGRAIIGHLAEFRADRLGFLAYCAKEYGDVVSLRLGPRPCLLLSDPPLIEKVFVSHAKHFIKHFGLRMYKPVLGNGLVSSEGDFWRRQRKLAAPAFHTSRLADYSKTMLGATAQMLDEWEDGTHDIHAEMTRLTLDLACKTLFGPRAFADARVVGHALNESMDVIGSRMRRVIRAPLWFPTPGNVRLWRSIRTLNAIVERIIREGRAAVSEENTDLLSILLRAQDDDGSVMTDRQLLDEVRTLFVAGHETTALTLTYALYLLSDHPEIQQQLFDELHAAIGSRLPVYADLPKLRMARNVIFESLRLYPPADILGRQAAEDCTIDGIHIRKHTNVFASAWVMHRDARFFPNPQRFDPDRWTDSFEKSLPRFAYFPFGGGPRVCIGQSFAITEATLVLAAICRQFSFAPAPRFKLELWPAITLRPRNGMKLIVSRRKAEMVDEAEAISAGQAQRI